jgi:hypothetical protein
MIAVLQQGIGGGLELSLQFSPEGSNPNGIIPIKRIGIKNESPFIPLANNWFYIHWRYPHRD